MCCSWLRSHFCDAVCSTHEQVGELSSCVPQKVVTLVFTPAAFFTCFQETYAVHRCRSEGGWFRGWVWDGSVGWGRMDLGARDGSGGGVIPGVGWFQGGVVLRVGDGCIRELGGLDGSKV